MSVERCARARMCAYVCVCVLTSMCPCVQSSHDKKLHCIAKTQHRYSAFDELRSDLITTVGGEVAAIVDRLAFPPKTWGVVSLTEAELDERRVGLESE